MAQGRYVSTFRTIELQTTFYEPPQAAVARKWKALAPADFHFCMKAWQLITHTPSSPTYRRLKSGVSPEEHDLYGSFRPTEQVRLAWERTREIATAIDARVVVFQCPKSFLPLRENLRNIASFFRDIDRGDFTLAWEPRGPEWKPDLVRGICREHGLIHCVDPFEADPAYGDIVYWRLHGLGGYRYKYTDEDLAELAAKLGDAPGYVMFNNIYAAPDALRFLARSEP